MIATAPDGLLHAIDAYVTELRGARRLSPRTISAYAADLRDYLVFAGGRGLRSWRLADQDFLTAYFVDLSRRDASTATVARRRFALIGFHAYLIRQSLQDCNPARQIPPVRRQRRLPSVLSVADVERLLEQPRGDAPLVLRDRAMLELAYASALRVSELIELTRDRLVLGDRAVKVIGKGNRERWVPFGRAAALALTDWIRRGRPVLAGDEALAQERLFVNLRGGPMSRMGFWKILRGYSTSAKIKARVHPHALRHSCATHLRQGGADLRVVQELLGHASIQTTTIYDSVDITRLIESHRLHHPRP